MLAGRKIGVLGMGRSGLATARRLARAGAEVVVFDDDPTKLDGLAHRPGTAGDVSGLSFLVVSPGVPLTHPAPHPLVEKAREAGVRLTCDVDLFAAELRSKGHRLVAVTGTNGKSTTATLIHHLLRAAGQEVLLGGNIGRPVFDLDLPESRATVVLELSSFQLDLCSDLHPDVAVWLNLTADHLDRHGDLDNYVRAKRRLFARMNFDDHAVVGVDDAPSIATADLLARCTHVVRIGRAADADYRVAEGVLHHGDRPVCRLDTLESLRGAHNHQNAAAAVAALRCLGVDEAAIVAGLATFESLPHRMEEVARLGSVRFVNDSKATNPEAAARSLASFHDIHWIAGGRPKPGGFGDLLPLVGHIAHGYFIGEAADALTATFESRFATSRHASLQDALRAAADAASARPAEEVVVLLAPACASYDQFRDFEQRGDLFRDEAKRIVAARMAVSS